MGRCFHLFGDVLAKDKLNWQIKVESTCRFSIIQLTLEYIMDLTYDILLYGKLTLTSLYRSQSWRSLMPLIKSIG